MSVKNPNVLFEMGLAPRKQRQHFDVTAQHKELGSQRTARRNFRNAQRRLAAANARKEG